MVSHCPGRRARRSLPRPARAEGDAGSPARLRGVRAAVAEPAGSRCRAAEDHGVPLSPHARHARLRRARRRGRPLPPGHRPVAAVPCEQPLRDAPAGLQAAHEAAPPALQRDDQSRRALGWRGVLSRRPRKRALAPHAVERRRHGSAAQHRARQGFPGVQAVQPAFAARPADAAAADAEHHHRSRRRCSINSRSSAPPAMRSRSARTRKAPTASPRRSSIAATWRLPR